MLYEVITTWKTYYDPEKLYTDKTDAQMQTIMDARMEEAIRRITSYNVCYTKLLRLWCQNWYHWSQRIG